MIIITIIIIGRILRKKCNNLLYMIEPSPTEGTHGKGIDNEPLNSSQQEGAPEECVQKEVEYENSSQR